MKAKLSLLGILILLCSIPAISQNEKDNIYSGGMLLLQPGYAFTENRHQEIQDPSLGVGGILRFYFHKHLTVGIYGGTQRVNYNSSNSENSYLNLGYGGPFLGFTQKKGKIRYTLSAFVGGGTVKNLHIENQSDNLLSEAYLYKNSTLIISPILSLDYALTQRLNLTFQTVCLSGKFDGDKTLYNPVFQIGVLFCR